MSALSTLHPPPKVGSSFPSYAAFIEVVNDWSIQAKFDYKVNHKDTTRAILVCAEKNKFSACQWRIRANLDLLGAVFITVLNPLHTCQDTRTPMKRAVATRQRWVQGAVARQIDITEDTKPQEILECLKVKYDEIVDLKVAQRIKKGLLKRKDQSRMQRERQLERDREHEYQQAHEELQQLQNDGQFNAAVDDNVGLDMDVDAGMGAGVGVDVDVGVGIDVDMGVDAGIGMGVDVGVSIEGPLPCPPHVPYPCSPPVAEPLHRSFSASSQQQTHYVEDGLVVQHPFGPLLKKQSSFPVQPQQQQQQLEMSRSLTSPAQYTYQTALSPFCNINTGLPTGVGVGVAPVATGLATDMGMGMEMGMNVAGGGMDMGIGAGIGMGMATNTVVAPDIGADLRPTPGTVLAQTIQLRPEAVEGYRECHARVWPEVIEQMKARNICDYHIFFEPPTTLFSTFRYTGTDLNADMRALAEHPKVRAWWSMTSAMQLGSVPDTKGTASGMWWKPLEEFFYLP